MQSSVKKKQKILQGIELITKGKPNSSSRKPDQLNSSFKDVFLFEVARQWLQIISVVLSILAIALPSVAMAKVFIVGDDIGWTIGFDYQGWAAGKDFRVGDQIVFQYPMGAHNVHKVNGTDFKSCSVPPLSEALISGYDVVTLATPGRKWYICGVGRHCEIGGQKLFIMVQPLVSAPTMPPAATAPAPAPTSTYRWF